MEKLCTVGLSGLEMTDKVENKVRLYTVKMTCRLRQEWTAGNRKVAFVVTALNGKKWVIGSYARPYPVVTQKTVMPDTPSGVSGTEMTVTYTADNPPFLAI